VAAEGWLFEEARGELVIAHFDHVLEPQSASTLVPRRRRRALGVRRIARVRQPTTRVAAAHAGVHRGGWDARSSREQNWAAKVRPR